MNADAMNAIDAIQPPRPIAAPRPTVQATAFPGLGELIRLTEEALGQRDCTAIVATLRARLPALIARHRGALGGEFLRADPQRRRRVELHHCPVLGYQILAMIWGPGQGTPIHDHHELWGVESTWHGELLVADFQPTTVAGELVRLEPRDAVCMRTGEALGLTPEQGLHLCRNPSQREVAVTVHIYARALDRFNLYVDAGDGWYRRREYCPETEY